jgi:predicted nucleic acid-binding protein
VRTLQLRDAKASLSAVVNAAEAIGRHPGFADTAVAAIAKSHNLVVLTMNRRHFDRLRVEALNPFEAA